MADEAYRAVFLRVHPTGKMVLSLTTETDGNEPRYAQLVADELGVPALDVKVVPADTDRFGVGHGYNTSPSEGTAAAVTSAAGKIRDKAQQLAGDGARRSGRQPELGRRRLLVGRERRAVRRSPTSRSTRTGPERSRRESRAASTPRRSTATSASAGPVSRGVSAARLQPAGRWRRTRPRPRRRP